MSAQYLPIIVATINLMLLSVLGFYLWVLDKERKELKKQKDELTQKQKELENNYQQVIDSALSKERNILDEATKKATAILSNTKYLSNFTQNALDQALQKMFQELRNAAYKTSTSSLENYSNYLNQISQKTLVEFQNTTRQYEAEMQKKMEEFRNSLLPAIEKELEEYKQKRLKNADKAINEIIKRVSEKVFIKSTSKEDQQRLIIESLEKCLKEGIFD